MTTKTTRRFVGSVEGLERREAQSGFMAAPVVAMQIGHRPAVVQTAPSGLLAGGFGGHNWGHR